MADPEVLFCHICKYEWNRDDRGLECPTCHSDFVEEIVHGRHPRQGTVEEDDDNEGAADRLPSHHPLHSHNPWRRDEPDPEEGDIEHVEWNTGPGIRFSHTSYRSSRPGMGQAGQRINDPLAPFFQSFIMEGGSGAQHQSPFGGGPTRQNGSLRSSTRSPSLSSIPSFPLYEHRGSGPAPGSPLQEGLPGHGFGAGRSTYTATTRVWPRDGNNATQQAPIENLHELLGTLIQGLNSLNQNGQMNAGPNGASAHHHIFAQFLNPANAAHGDAVYTEEALDRVITQFMEQTYGSSAPGPASAEAISRLPKKKADKSMMGSDGKAECSVCMDNVEIGDEVTVLPCSHWFHGECVGAWLKEHDTCPHCRQGIMPKDVEGSQTPSPRSPGQPSRNDSFLSLPTPDSDGRRTMQFTWPSQPQLSPSTLRNAEPPSRPHSDHRRRSSARESRNGGEGSSGGGGSGGGSGGGGGGSGGLSGWVRDRWRGNSDRA